MKNPGDWQQYDSDVVAHFLQVRKQLVTSRWYSTDPEFQRQGGKVIDCTFPPIEDFIYAAVYMRQLLPDDGDDLFEDAVERYSKHKNSSVSGAKVVTEKEKFKDYYYSTPFFIEKYTVRKMFRAFIYGLGLMHGPPHPKSTDRSNFMKLFRETEQVRLLYSLHMSLKQLLNHISPAATIVHRDFAHWLQRYELPHPTIKWHESLFEVTGDQ